MLLEELKDNNEFPILFIGAGISKRFLDDYPDWVELLYYFWDKSGGKNFYGEFNKINDIIHKGNAKLEQETVRQYALVKMGTMVEEKFNEAFNDEKIKIDNFSTEDAFNLGVSPLKKAIALKFESYKIKQGMKNEYDKFKKMLSKSQIILTTNYDKFIENSYKSASKYGIKTYVGQRGFFEETGGFSELYNIHGSIDYPKDIVITEEDYKKFNENSMLISAKITSLMMHSPIVFIGYSLSDINIRKIIRNITNSLSNKELAILEKRLIVIQWEKGQKNLLQEKYKDRDLGCEINIIKTDNYEKIFDEISAINQGLTPSEVQKYMSVIKRIVIDQGKKGTLDTVLCSPEGIEKISGELSKKNIVVAIGGPEYVFQIPDLFTYCIDYISDEDEIANNVRLRFLALENPSARTPLCKLLDKSLIDSSNLLDREKTKLKKLMVEKTDFNKAYNSIPKSGYFIPTNIDVKHIIDSSEKKRKIYNTLSYYIKKLDLEDLKGYILNELNSLKKSKASNISSELRKLMLLYDILKNKK